MISSLNSWLLLYMAIGLEVSGTVAIKLSDGFTRFVPSVCVVVLYCASFSLMSLAVRKIHLGVAYAIWSGVGIIATFAIGVFFFQETISPRKIISILIIMIGVVSLNLAPGK